MDIEGIMDDVSPLLEWASVNWMPLVLTGEIVGAVVAIKLRRYYRGMAWLLAALMTIWLVRVRLRHLFLRTAGAASGDGPGIASGLHIVGYRGIVMSHGARPGASPQSRCRWRTPYPISHWHPWSVGGATTRRRRASS